MRRYLLDTAPLAALLLARPAAVDLISFWFHRHEVATSILAYAEVVEYIKDFADAKRRQPQLRTLLGEVYPYFLTYPILERYTDIRRRLRKPHGKGLIGDIDTLIAATALERNLTVVTIDSDFQRVPQLQVILLSPTNLQVLSTP
jgi:predicted nucleic acid-binding protein